MSKIVKEALKVVGGDRKEAYGPVEESFRRIAMVWSSLLKRTVTPHEVALMMIGLKLCRETNKHSDDNLVDIVGYILCDEQILENL